ncbi:hypothetical protein Goshw_006412 [Gossypium schwendimanii]|uniref:Uncharacterized protein n=1 Tax=Gossypium schwendimanii TaxID=34291 RepID=A0A7J9N1F1_GOSSC|nr:hypothetical protein [Gossypium schwendimanii]
MMELRASLRKIEEMNERIEELESALQNCEIRIEYLETNKDHQRKGRMANAEEGDNDEPLYLPGFNPPHVQTQAEVHPYKSFVIIRL